jgi:predicted DNA-binding transcriptional regulator AlpA
MQDNSQNASPEMPILGKGYLRLPQVLTLIPVSKATWWAGVRSGRYPKSVKLSPNCTAWKVEDINDLKKRIDESNATAL